MEVGRHAGAGVHVQEPGRGLYDRVLPQHPVVQSGPSGERPPGQRGHLSAVMQELPRDGPCLRHRVHLLVTDLSASAIIVAGGGPRGHGRSPWPVRANRGGRHLEDDRRAEWRSPSSRDVGPPEPGAPASGWHRPGVLRGFRWMRSAPPGWGWPPALRRSRRPATCAWRVPGWRCRDSGRSAPTPPAAWPSGERCWWPPPTRPGRSPTRRAWRWPPWRPARPRAARWQGADRARRCPATTCWGWTASCWSRPPGPMCSPPPPPSWSEPGWSWRGPTSRPAPRLSSCCTSAGCWWCPTSSPTPAGSFAPVSSTRAAPRPRPWPWSRSRSRPTPPWCWTAPASSASCRGRRPRTWPGPHRRSQRLPPQLVTGVIRSANARRPERRLLLATARKG
jgi:hypothetical protein